MLVRFVDPSYLAFLSKHDAMIPQKDRPWLWAIQINGIDYGIPFTTQETAAGYIGWLRCGANPEHGLYLRYMIPLPEQALLPQKPLSEDLRKELLYWEHNRQYITEEAKILHRLSSQGQMDKLYLNHSCNYAALDKIYTQWTPGMDAGRFLYPTKEVQPMPVSKKGNLYYTKEQYEQAKYNGNALEYAKSQGYNLVRQGGYYTMQEHDSMVFTPSGRWFWNSRGVHGGALEFMMYYEGRTITEAVLTLAGEQDLVFSKPQQRPEAAPRPAPAKAQNEVPTNDFQLPAKASDFKRLFGYLCGDRGLDKCVVQEMIRQDRVFQSTARMPGGKVLTNATFVYQDEAGQPVGAFQRGMYDRPGTAPYKRDAPGSDKRFGWLLASPFEPAAAVHVFEGAIDAASDASLVAMKHGDIWRKEPIDRLSLEGLGFQPLQTYLQAHPNVRHVVLMLDNDAPGRKAAANIAWQLKHQGYTVEDRVPPFGKDWNEVLTETRSMEVEQYERTPQPEAPEM